MAQLDVARPVRGVAVRRLAEPAVVVAVQVVVRVDQSRADDRPRGNRVRGRTALRERRRARPRRRSWRCARGPACASAQRLSKCRPEHQRQAGVVVVGGQPARRGVEMPHQRPGAGLRALDQREPRCRGGGACGRPARANGCGSRRSRRAAERSPVPGFCCARVEVADDDGSAIGQRTGHFAGGARRDRRHGRARDGTRRRRSCRRAPARRRPRPSADRHVAPAAQRAPAPATIISAGTARCPIAARAPASRMRRPVPHPTSSKRRRGQRWRHRRDQAVLEQRHRGFGPSSSAPTAHRPGRGPARAFRELPARRPPQPTRICSGRSGPGSGSEGSGSVARKIVARVNQRRGSGNQVRQTGYPGRSRGSAVSLLESPSRSPSLLPPDAAPGYAERTNPAAKLSLTPQATAADRAPRQVRAERSSEGVGTLPPDPGRCRCRDRGGSAARRQRQYPPASSRPGKPPGRGERRHRRRSAAASPQDDGAARYPHGGGGFRSCSRWRCSAAPRGGRKSRKVAVG